MAREIREIVINPDGTFESDAMNLPKFLETGELSSIRILMPQPSQLIELIERLAGSNLKRVQESSQGSKLTDLLYKSLGGLRHEKQFPNLWQEPLLRLMIACKYPPESVALAIQTKYLNKSHDEKEAFNVAAKKMRLAAIFPQKSGSE